VVGLKRVQSLGRFNYNLGDSWSIILQQLDRRIDELVKKELFVLPEIESKFGYKTIKSKLVEIGTNQFFDVHIHRGSEVRLEWDDKMIYNVTSRQTIIEEDVVGNDLLNMINELEF
jgi:cupin superfamily acireductone dioxygenase involved in methionine salvage